VGATGRWAVRVAGANGTQGAYSVSFSIGASPPASVRGSSVTVASGAVVPFEATGGSLVDVSVTWRDPHAAVTLASLTGPTGAAVAGANATVKPTSLTIRGLKLPAADGSYALHLATASDTTFNAAVKVTPQGRPSSRKPVALSPAEPFLAS